MTHLLLIQTKAKEAIEKSNTVVHLPYTHENMHVIHAHSLTHTFVFYTSISRHAESGQSWTNVKRIPYWSEQGIDRVVGLFSKRLRLDGSDG